MGRFEFRTARFGQSTFVPNAPDSSSTENSDGDWPLSVLADDGCPNFPDEGDHHEEQASLRPAIAELERAFRMFADLSFKRQMPLPVITIQTAGRKAAAAWFWQERWQNGQPRRLPEINICAEYLNLGVEDIAEFLLHEMCHYANYLDGIRDCSSSQYHNRRFKRRCDQIGLTCERGRRGWANTRLSPELREVVRQVNLDAAAFSMCRARAQYLLVEVEAQPERRLRRWTCECKKSKKSKKSKVIYASRGLNVTCNACLKVYRESPLA